MAGKRNHTLSLDDDLVEAVKFRGGNISALANEALKKFLDAFIVKDLEATKAPQDIKELAIKWYRQNKRFQEGMLPMPEITELFNIRAVLERKGYNTESITKLATEG